MKSIQALFLDVGGVLLTNGWDRQMRKEAVEIFHLDEEEINERHGLLFEVYEIGRINLDQYLDGTVFYRPRNFTKEQFKDFMFAQSQPYPEMIQLVRDFKEKYRLKTIIISNEGRELMHYRIERFDLRSFVDFFICSAFVQARKPDPTIFQLALDMAQVPSSQIAYIDDRPLMVEIAERFGMHGIHHQNVAETQLRLQTLIERNLA